MSQLHLPFPVETKPMPVLDAIQDAVNLVKQHHPVIPVRGGAANITVFVPPPHHAALKEELGLPLNKDFPGMPFYQDLLGCEFSPNGIPQARIKVGGGWVSQPRYDGIAARYIYGVNQVTEVRLDLGGFDAPPSGNESHGGAP